MTEPKIYCVGASGVGKTTLSRYVHEKHGLPLLTGATKEAARAVGLEELGVVTRPRDSDEQGLVDAFQKEVWKQQMAIEAPFWDEGKGFVSDRSFDLLAYTSRLSSVSWQLNQRNKDFLDYLSRLREPDVLVLFLRPNKKVKAKRDGRRDAFLTPEFTFAVDGVIEYILECHEIPYVPVTSDKFRDRMRLVDRLVALLKR